MHNGGKNMKIEGECDFCGKHGDWEAGMFDRQRDALVRPKEWAALFPWSRKTMPKGCTFDTTTLEKFDVKTRFACPNCFRKKLSTRSKLDAR
jgi:hypothetical protein